MVLKVVQSIRFRIRIFKMGRGSANKHFSYPPPRFYRWGECSRVYGFKRSSVHAVPQPNFQNGTLQCEQHISRIHHHVFMDEDSLAEYIVLKVVQSRRFRTRIFKMGRCKKTFLASTTAFLGMGIPAPLIFKMGRCTARTHFSHPPPRFYGGWECSRVYGFKSSSVHTVPHPNIQNGTLQCENTFLASTTTFLWMRRVYQSIWF